MSEVVAATVDLDVHEARELTDRIRGTLQLGHHLMLQAYAGRAWSALGYLSWDAYCAGEFTEARMIRLPVEQRREIVAEMTDAGMSTRAIASGLGVDPETARRDQRAGAANAAPASVTGTDGKTYTRPATDGPPAPEPAEEGDEMTVITAQDRAAGKPSVPLAERREQIAELAASRHTSQEMATALGVGEQYIREFSKRHGIPIPADAAMHKAHRLDSARILTNTAETLDGLASGLRLINLANLDPEDAALQSESIAASLRVLAKWNKSLKELSN